MRQPKIPTDLLIKLRKLLHKYPEPSGQEYDTAQRIKGFLKSYRPTKLLEGIGGNGIAAIYQKYNTGTTVMVRCELDALSAREENVAEIDKGHKSGHDGHMAIVAGLAPILARRRPKEGRIVLLFQPAKETGHGAERVIEDDLFGEIEPDYIYALHNLPGFPTGNIIIKDGVFVTASRGLSVKIISKDRGGGSNNTAYALATILAELENLSSKGGKNGTVIITPVYAKLGEELKDAVPEAADLFFNLKASRDEEIDQVADGVRKKIKSICEAYAQDFEIEWRNEFLTTRNNPECVDIVKSAAKENELDCKKVDVPFNWADDFGRFTEQYKGAMFGIGAGQDYPRLNSIDYDFPDKIIDTGVSILYSVINKTIEIA